MMIYSAGVNLQFFGQLSVILGPTAHLAFRIADTTGKDKESPSLCARRAEKYTTRETGNLKDRSQGPRGKEKQALSASDLNLCFALFLCHTQE